MKTYTGVIVKLGCLESKDVRVEDIAHSLALQCAWLGHTMMFYSLAQRACLVSVLAQERGGVRSGLVALFADGGRVYNDGPEDVGMLTDVVIRAVSAGLPLVPYGARDAVAAVVRDAYTTVSAVEQRDLFRVREATEIAPAGGFARIQPLGWKDAKQAFLARYEALIDNLS